MIIQRLDEQTCEKMKELCKVNAVALYQIAKESGLPMNKPARLFITVFEEICDAAEADVRAEWGEVVMDTKQFLKCAQAYQSGLYEGLTSEPDLFDLGEYSNKLWHEAYERGRLEGRKTGKWIHRATGLWCSECEISISDEILCFCDLHFCPLCGAKMEESYEVADNS